MDHTRVHRIGNRPYYRSNYTPTSNSRQTIEERLQGRGVSTSSNSSWTFSNSHSDVPKPTKGRLCGIFLVGAVFVVIVAVLAIGGLAFYLGALRIEAIKQELVFDGSFRITYGDQYQPILSNYTSNYFQEKAKRYVHMLTSVYQKSVIGPALQEVTITKFENGSLIVHFRINLDRRKIPSSVTMVEDTLRKILIDEISSVKPIAFRNLQVDRHNLHIKRLLDEQPMTSGRTDSSDQTTRKNDVEVRNGVLRKKPIPTDTEEQEQKGEDEEESVEEEEEEEEEEIEIKVISNEPGIVEGVGIPEGAILGISETMQNLSESVKMHNKEKPTTPKPEMDLSDIKSINFNEDVKPNNTNKVYQSVYITSDNVHIKNGSGKTEKFPGVIEGSYKITNGEFVETQPKVSEESPKNGHARPPFAEKPNQTTAIPGSSSVHYVVPEYVEEPWKPIVPNSEEPAELKDSYVDIYDSIISEDRIGELTVPTTPDVDDIELENESPITFSKETYEQNLKIVPEFAGNQKIKFQNLKNNKLSRITDDLAKKYKDLLKNHRITDESDVAGVADPSGPIETKTDLPLKRTTPTEVYLISETSTSSSTTEKLKTNLPLGLDQMISGIKQLDSGLGEITETTTETPEVTTVNKMQNTETAVTNVTAKEETPTNVTVKNPFLETDDSRASTGFNFGIPDLPILKQFHHLDSLLKSFSKPSSSAYQAKEIANVTESSVITNETTNTRFPVRTKATTEKQLRTDEKVYIEISTISPENSTRHKPTTKKPAVVAGEAEPVEVTGKGEDVSFNKLATITTTEVPKLITLLPVRSNVNMKRPLRPRPKTGEKKSIDFGESYDRKSKMNWETKPQKSSRYSNNGTGLSPKVLYSVPSHQFVDDKDGRRWVYYSSSKLQTSPPSKAEKLFIVTPEPKTEAKEYNDAVPLKFAVKAPEVTKKNKTSDFQANVTKLPLYNTIESLLNSDNRQPEAVNSTSGQVETEQINNNTSEIIDRIVKIMENVAISSGNSTNVIMKVNQTLVNGTEARSPSVVQEEEATNNTEIGISTKAVSSNYKLNQAGVPVLTKVLNKAPYINQDASATNFKLPLNEGTIISHVTKECDNNSIRCGNGVCLPASSRCNQLVDCPDAADEKNCTCLEHLKAQHLHRKQCDGIVDCWDFSDEYNCEWCKEKQYLCSNSRMCINQSQICDGTNNCPLGDDERYCVTVSPSKDEADSFDYHHNGYLMVRKNGRWGKMCIDNFELVSEKSKTGWKITDLGRSVCKALTFKDFEKVERMVSVPNEGRSIEVNEKERYYELSFNGITDIPETYTRDSMLTFHETDCSKREVVKVTCTDLECGLRPQAINQWSRIVGGGNASPGSWPWQAALYKEGEFQCGATLISEQWLVSAGHCFYHNQDEYWVARLGTLRTSSFLPSPYEQLRQISKIILHPQYVDTGFINDISLLKMSDPVRFTDYVRPICLPKVNTKIIDGMMCTVVGWGQLFEIGRIFPDTLQEVQLPIISSHECRKRTVFLPLYKITDDMFCAGFDRGGRDACLGDSGGPLMCQESDGKWSLYGVTSNGYGCARSNRPGVYTKVSEYIYWIQSQMNLHAEDDTTHVPYPVRDTTSEGSNNFSKNDTDTKLLLKLISERMPNVKLSTMDTTKAKDKCKGLRCPLGECLPKSRICNGYIECSDGSDEKDCW